RPAGVLAELKLLGCHASFPPPAVSIRPAAWRHAPATGPKRSAESIWGWRIGATARTSARTRERSLLRRDHREDVVFTQNDVLLARDADVRARVLAHQDAVALLDV